MSVYVLSPTIFFTTEDGEFLVRHNRTWNPGRIQAVQTGGCPHAAIREDISANLIALEHLHDEYHPELLLLESGGDNLAAHFSRELADFTVYVIDVAAGDKIPRKGGPGITQSDLLVINKTDLAPAVGADLSIMDRDARLMRGDGPFIFAQIKAGVSVDQIVSGTFEKCTLFTRGGMRLEMIRLFPNTALARWKSRHSESRTHENPEASQTPQIRDLS